MKEMDEKMKMYLASLALFSLALLPLSVFSLGS